MNEAEYTARLREIEASLDRMPPAAQSFALLHLEAVKQADRLRAAHMGYVLDFILDCEELAYLLLSLPVLKPDKVAGPTMRGSGF